MPPTGRDLFRSSLATIAMASIAVLPVISMAAEPPRLLSLIDASEQVPYGVAVIRGMVWVHWAERWSLAEREHFLTVIEHEFSDLTADVIEHLQWVIDQEGTV